MVLEMFTVTIKLMFVAGLHGLWKDPQLTAPAHQQPERARRGV